MTVGMIPSLVFARELDYEPEDPEVAESSEPEKEEETKPQVKETEKSKDEEPADTKAEEPKTEEPEEPKAEEPAEAKEEEPAESKEEVPAETKEEQPAESKPEEPSETQGEEPAETDGEEANGEDDAIPEEYLKDVEAVLPGGNYKEPGKSNNDELFNRYVESKFSTGTGSGAFQRKAKAAGSKFTGFQKLVYDQLKTQIAKAASGEKIDPSTTFHVNTDASGAKVSSFTAKQLGVPSVYKLNQSTNKYEIPSDAMAAFSKKTSVIPILCALLVDCPYELYWYDKEKGVDYLETMVGIRLVNNEYALYFKDGMDVAFYVADEYACDTFRINSSKIERVNKSIANAKKIVLNAKDKSDYEKLVEYRKAICNRVEYDQTANDTIPYGDPWQLVSVFDDDPKTNVVCEGYSKAFKYLCDLTSFEKPIECIISTGTSIVDGDSGGHMWNIVTMEDGKHYLVDVTNCDSGCIGYPDKLFLAGYLMGSSTTSYTYRCGYSYLIEYVYNSMTTFNFSSELVMSSTAYAPAGASGKCGTNLTWSITGTTLTISGTGAMKDYAPGDVAPWDNYAKNITNIVISEGVTSIGEVAFFKFSEIKTIKLPQSLTKIGSYALGGCAGLTSVKIPNGVKTIGEKAFSTCVNLTRVTIREDLHKSITSDVFQKCPKAVFYDYVVAGDYELQITNPATNGTGTVTFIGMANPTEAVVVPNVAEINGVFYKVTRIGVDAFFQDKTIKTLVIGANVVIIDGNACYGCPELVKVSGGKGLKTIGANAFAHCPKLSSFTIVASKLSKIGASAFYGDSKLKTLYIKKTTKLTKGGVKNSLKGSSVKTVKVKKSKVRKYKKFFKKSNSGRKVKVKK